MAQLSSKDLLLLGQSRQWLNLSSLGAKNRFISTVVETWEPVHFFFLACHPQAAAFDLPIRIFRGSFAHLLRMFCYPLSKRGSFPYWYL